MLLLFFVVIPLIGAILTWMNTQLFLSKRDYWRLSPYELAEKKVSLGCSAFIAIAVILFFILTFLASLVK